MGNPERNHRTAAADGPDVVEPDRRWVPQGKKVLVIDDSAIVRELIRRMLTRSGFVVVEAVDGLDGKRKLDAGGDFCLVLCDVHMPRMNGVDMLEAIQAEARHTAIPVIMLTNEGRPSLLRRAGRAGAKGWLKKPFKAHQLLSAAARVVD
jgi:CheY-like chemotaxis protein